VDQGVLLFELDPLEVEQVRLCHGMLQLADVSHLGKPQLLRAKHLCNAADRMALVKVLQLHQAIVGVREEGLREWQLVRLCK